MCKRLLLSSETLTSLRSLLPYSKESEQTRLAELILGKPARPGDTFAAAQLTHCPHAPWPRQQLFLDLPHREAFYGGAAGGGTGEWLTRSVSTTS